MSSRRFLAKASAALALLLIPLEPALAAGQTDAKDILTAYPEYLSRIEGGMLVWRDGTRMLLDDGKGPKSFEAWLEAPDIEDMLALRYMGGDPDLPPPRDHDPGRARNAPFFAHMYGDCRKGQAQGNLVEIVWLPKKAGQRLKVTRVNGVADKLSAISRELDELPARFDGFLKPAAGAYNCRAIAGTDRSSAHGYGIAIDIALKHAHYWRWSKPDASGLYPYKNEIPLEIVRTFEKHGFIWGGRWHHYDTMHFEYRPELLPPAR